MKEYEIKEGDIVEIAYTSEFTDEYVNEGKALVMWKGFNHQPLVHKLSTKNTIWSGYDRIAKVVGHVDIEWYMENAIALEQEPCEDAVSREEAVKVLRADPSFVCAGDKAQAITDILSLPSVTPQPKTAHWIHFANGDDCSGCGWSTGKYISPSDYCPKCGARMVEPAESEEEE